MKRFIYDLIVALILVGIGIFMIAKPTTFLGVLAIVFALYLIFEGCKSIYFFIKLRSFQTSGKWVVLIKAVIDILIGIIALVLSINDMTAVSTIVVYMIAATLYLEAITNFVNFFTLRTFIPFAGFGSEAAFSLLFAILFCLFPQFVTETAVTIIGVIVIASGVVLAVLGFHALSLERTLKKYGITLDGKKNAEAEYTEIK